MQYHGDVKFNVKDLNKDIGRIYQILFDNGYPVDPITTRVSSGYILKTSREFDTLKYEWRKL